MTSPIRSTKSFGADHNLEQLEAAIVGDTAGEAALVVAGHLETAGEAHQSWAVRRRGQRGDDARVEAAAQVRADRHIRAEVEGDRIGQQLLRAALVEVVCVVEVRLEVDLPVAMRFDLSVPNAKEVAGLTTPAHP